ncbi:MAG: flagellar protein FlgN [Nitrospinae bacterium]|nr:flagellar protein FlgN [Nitrospinota bacterium]
MKRLYKNLQDVLEQKIKLYENFIQLLNEEWKSVAQYSYDDLQIIIAKKDDQVMQMQALENSRSSLMKKIAGNLNMKPSALTLKRLIQFKDNPYRVNLSNCRSRLLSKINKINILSAKIKALMDHSALSLKKSLAFIHSEGEKAHSPYEANGQVNEGKLQSRMVSVDA